MPISVRPQPQDGVASTGRLGDVWATSLRALRAVSRHTPHAVILVCIVSTAILQCIAMLRGFSLSGLFLAILLVGGPLSSYSFYAEVNRSGRPALSALMLAVAAFFAMIALAIAELGAPISTALSRSPIVIGAVSPKAPPTPSASDLNPSPPQRRRASQEGRTARVVAPPLSARPPATGVDAVADAAIAPTYSLYDMLSLLGMVATVSLIALGALVPEETKLLERRREDRLLMLEALGDFTAKVHAFKLKPSSTECAIGARNAASRLVGHFRSTGNAGAARKAITDLMNSLLVSHVIEGGYVDPGHLPELPELIERIDQIAYLVEND